MANVHPADGGGDRVQARSWPDVLGALISGADLSSAETAWAMDQVMTGEATTSQVAGFLVALRAKGETVGEITGLVEAMYAHATVIEVPGRAVDIVGTGGDRAKTVNISTMSAIVAAGAGALVVKHGNRAASSASGATDVLEQLGINLRLTAPRIAQVAVEAGITYCPAPVFHPAMRHAGTARGDLGVPTSFNLLGPLTNPARVGANAVGCFDTRMAGLIAGVLAERGSSALVFRGDDGLDELTVTGTSTVWQVRNGSVERFSFDPHDVGVEYVGIEALRGADAAYNAKVARRVLAGEPGPVRDAVLLNSASALVALDQTDAPLVEQMRAAMKRTAESIDSGAAEQVLARWAQATHRQP
ncbi:anthranilate phosphoribosyltransferase [Streptacidiphilus sp. PB12-B1b]|uniref:anthranilate phosphoribosyltransferase n=1 Tax=Streptacidiphilus sp. PB12-B1b TaxID=2705012 RepID=UPI0015FAB013|nr:anthranilate phosphoribosyltransferase [Streptacidiphilus sp. PB12-B1b]QMU75864.1 anthranilate phosphoribosyltransferase [Streptacidiphilus sp. PB12-B1b]